MKNISFKLVAFLLFLGIFVNTITIPEKIKAAEGEYKVNVTVTYDQTEARKMLSKINKFRQGNDAWAWNDSNSKKVKYKNLGKLKYDYNLEKIAMQRAAEISVSFDHNRPDATPWYAAYGDHDDYYGSGENIAFGYKTAESVFLGWKEDDEKYSGQGHRRNMLGAYDSVGIGHVVRNGFHFWVQEFGYIPENKDAGEGRFDKTKPVNSSKSVKITLLKEYISSVSLTKTSLELKKGKKYELNDVRYKIEYYENYGGEIKVKASYKVSSENSKIVSVSDKMLIPKKKGSTYIKIKGLGKSKKIKVTVK